MEARHTSIKPSWWAQICAKAVDYNSAEIVPEGIKVHGLGECGVVSFRQLSQVQHKEGIFWSKLTLTLTSGRTVVLGGIPNGKIPGIAASIQRRRDEFSAAVRLFEDEQPTARQLIARLDQGMEGLHWVADHQLNAVIGQADGFRDALQIGPQHLSEDEDADPGTLPQLGASWSSRAAANAEHLIATARAPLIPPWLQLTGGRTIRRDPSAVAGAQSDAVKEGHPTIGGAGPTASPELAESSPEFPTSESGKTIVSNYCFWWAV